MCVASLLGLPAETPAVADLRILLSMRSALHNTTNPEYHSVFYLLVSENARDLGSRDGRPCSGESLKLQTGDLCFN